MPATRDPIAFFAFVSFFPQLVAGPIERAIHLLPQFQRDRSFDLAKAKDGMRQMLWGFFKKLVVADNCGLLSDRIYGYGEYGDVSGFTLFLAGVLFAFQVYGDFAGYSDIAIGTARLFGFELMRNFAYPFFSRDIAELWRRWHISLTTWFKDYLYIPLGGSRGGLNMKIRNALIVFTVSGFWHGADWTYVAWGALHGLFFVPLLLANRNRNHLDIVARGRLLPTWRECWQMFATFWLFCVALIVFRSASIPHAIDHLHHMVTNAFWAPVEILNADNLTILGIMIVLLVAEWIQRTREHTLEIAHLSTGWRWSIYAVVLIAIIYFGQYGDVRQFIYFQF
ncbi:MAG: MBOAT family O-acyltransferase, partial [Bacteroidota bacterium]